MNKLEGEDLHLNDEVIEVIRPEPVLVQLLPNEPFPNEPNKFRQTGFTYHNPVKMSEQSNLKNLST